MAEVILREYRPADLDAVFALDQACFAEAFRFSRRAMRGFAAARNAVVLVAEGETGGLAGFVIVHREDEQGYVVTLDIAPAHRRSGLATRLMLAAERLLAEKGIDTMLLHVHTGNEAAVRFYERAGYTRVELQAGFYGDGVDAFVYAKRLCRAQ